MIEDEPEPPQPFEWTEDWVAALQTGLEHPQEVYSLISLILPMKARYLLTSTFYKFNILIACCLCSLYHCIVLSLSVIGLSCIVLFVCSYTTHHAVVDTAADTPLEYL